MCLLTPRPSAPRPLVHAALHEPRTRLLAVATLLLASSACVNTDAAVFVEPSIDQASVSASGGMLGVGLTGGFRLTLHLGPRASGPSTVTLGTLSLKSADQKTAIVDPLPANPTPAFPVVVEPDSDETVTFAIDTGSKLLPSSVMTDLCASGGVVITAVLQDSLQDTATPAASAPVHPSGCP